MKVGDAIGHYRIVEPLGEGGMGEVFVAEDTRLNRRVALKILPPRFAADPDYRERFQREAQAVAALNHPNIVTIYSVEEQDERLFLTMELVEGKPLSHSIPGRGVPLPRLLRIAIDVADALAAAQQRGITHRDLKPANIIVMPDGRAKVLDFGLAKLKEAEIAHASEDATRMASRELTGEGKIIGTVAYMSPEQAEGKPVDTRSDIFSFGVVLHEMSTGQRPFKGDTNVSIISAIIKDTPLPITDSNSDLPADLARIVRRCLAKDTGRRYQTAADLRNELEELKQDSESGIAAAQPRAVPRASRRLFWIGAAAVIAVGAAGLWISTQGGRHDPTREDRDFVIQRFTRLTSTSTATLAALSRDGRYVVHVKSQGSNPSLWLRQTATTSDTQIVPAMPVRYDGLAFSPDGDHIYYNAYPGVSAGASPRCTEFPRSVGSRLRWFGTSTAPSVSTPMERNSRSSEMSRRKPPRS